MTKGMYGSKDFILSGLLKVFYKNIGLYPMFLKLTPFQGKID